MYHQALYYQVHEPSHLLYQAFKLQQHRQNEYFFRLGFAERRLSPFSQAIKYSKEMNVKTPTILPPSQPKPFLSPFRNRLLPKPPFCPFKSYNQPKQSQPSEDVVLHSINPNTTLVIYTDGSVRPRNPGIGGYAYVVFEPGDPQPKQREYIHNELVTINKCELLALYEAIQYCVERWNDKPRRIVIFSDNECSVNFIKGFFTPKYNHFYLVEKIRHDILTKMKCTPELYHMHSHQGYLGNELADQAAKSAQWWSEHCNPQLVQQVKTAPFVRRIKDVHKETRLFWDQQWQKKSLYFPSSSKDWCLKLLPTLDDAIKFNKKVQHLSPYLTKSICRLVTGYCNLHHPQFKWKLASTPDCLHCKVPETVTHFLLDCTKFDVFRTQLFDKLRILWIKSNPLLDPPTVFPPQTILTGHNLASKYEVEALKALGEYVRLSRVKL